MGNRAGCKLPAGDPLMFYGGTGRKAHGAPEATEPIKWAQPVYEDHGPFCYVQAFKNHVNFGFWRGAEIPDLEGMIESIGKKIGHVKLTGVEDVRPELFAEYVRAAVELNRTLGDPTKG